MYRNEYATANGARYEGAGAYDSFMDAMMAAQEAIRHALPGTRWLGAYKVREQSHAA